MLITNGRASNMLLKRWQRLSLSLCLCALSPSLSLPRSLCMSCMLAEPTMMPTSALQQVFSHFGAQVRRAARRWCKLKAQPWLLSLSLSLALSRCSSVLTSLSLSLTHKLFDLLLSLSLSLKRISEQSQIRRSESKESGSCGKKNSFRRKILEPAEFFAEKGRFSTGPVVVSGLRDDGDPELGRSSVRRPGKRTSR